MANLFQNPRSQIIARLLVSLNLGSIGGSNSGSWPTYYGNEPSSPDEIMTVFNTTGQDDGRSMVDGRLMEHYGFQVKIRSATESDGDIQAQLVRETLAYSCTSQIVITIGSYSYCVGPIVGIGQVLPLGREAGVTKRSLFTLNFLAIITPNN